MFSVKTVVAEKSAPFKVQPTNSAPALVVTVGKV
jgi:hypothetical protein